MTALALGILLAAATPSLQDGEYRLVAELLSKDARARKDAAESLRASGDRSLLAALHDVLTFYQITRDDMRALELTSLMRDVSGETVADPTSGWIEWIGRNDELRPKPGYLSFKAALFSLFDPALGDFFDPRHGFRIRAEEIQWGGVKKDGIPALDYPRQIEASEADYLDDDDLVFGISVGGEERAYPRRILVWHEMVNDFVGGVAVTLSYCTLCGSAILFDGRVDENVVYTFGTSGLLYRSNKLMYDRQTGSLWTQLTGEPVSGERAGSGSSLQKLPLVVTTWEDWRRRHPGTLVLDENTGFDRDYQLNPYEAYFRTDELMFPVWLSSDRLDRKERIFGLVVNGQPKAYPMDVLQKRRVVHDEVRGTRLVLLSDESGGVRVFETGGRRFAPGASAEELLEETTGTVWRVSEEVLVGPRGSDRLGRLAGHEAFWFGWYAFYPGTELYRE